MARASACRRARRCEAHGQTCLLQHGTTCCMLQPVQLRRIKMRSGMGKRAERCLELAEVPVHHTDPQQRDREPLVKSREECGLPHVALCMLRCRTVHVMRCGLPWSILKCRNAQAVVLHAVGCKWRACIFKPSRKRSSASACLPWFARISAFSKMRSAASGRPTSAEEASSQRRHPCPSAAENVLLSRFAISSTSICGRAGSRWPTGDVAREDSRLVRRVGAFDNCILGARDAMRHRVPPACAYLSIVLLPLCYGGTA